MESNFNNREFEHYIKNNADQYRMIPSEKVWKGINSTLHTRRKWYAIGLSMLLLLTGVSVTWVMMSYPVSKKQEISSAQNDLAISKQTKSVGKDKSSASKDISTILSFNKFSKPADVSTTDELPDILVNNSNETGSIISPIEIIDNNSDPELALQADKFLQGKNEISNYFNEVENNLPGGLAGISLIYDKKISKNMPPRMLAENKQPRNISIYPLSIESVVNSYQPKKVVKRLTWQLYVAPTVSYRKLSVNKSYDGSVSPFNTSNYPFSSSRDVNSEVVHKPDMGLELGVSTRYPLSKKLRLTGGFQFNINRYDIKAFAYYGEQATINLNGGTGNNSLTAWTYYRNYGGYKSDWLKNYYFSVSVPVGAELRLFGNDRTNFGIAGTVQPTYILKDRAFLISTDYKNYVEIPRLIRHVNVNTSFETYVSFTSRNNKTRMQVGPQVRYQILSSFKNKYPVKENLFDFGLKVGVSRNK